MGNATSSVAEIKKKGDEYNKAVRRERALSGMPGLAQQMSSKRFKKDDPNTEQWKVRNVVFVAIHDRNNLRVCDFRGRRIA